MVPATSARLGLISGNLNGLAADSSGNIYFADGSRIRKVSGGVITTVAGGGSSFGDNIPATSAFFNPSGLALDAAGNLYFADACANRIRKVAGGVITTVAGNGTADFFACAPSVAGGDGTATSVSLNGPQGVAMDSAGAVYFMESTMPGQVRARKVSNGTITTVAGGSNGPPVGAAVSDNVPAIGALLSSAAGSLAVDAGGNLYIPDCYWLALPIPNGVTFTGAPEVGRLRKVSNGVITTIAGANSDSGPASGTQLNLPAGIALDGAGNLYIADSGKNIIREVSNGAITTIAGIRILGSQGDGGAATSAALFNPQGVAVDPRVTSYIADGDGSIRMLSHGLLTTLGSPSGLIPGVALDSGGDLYFADFLGNRIRQLVNGLYTTIAGDGTMGFGGDNDLAISAQLSGPSGVAHDNGGNIYFTDSGNQRVRRISNGIITTVAGNGTAGFSGDNGPATSAQLNLWPPFDCPDNACAAHPPPSIPYNRLPAGIAVDTSGNLYIVDSGNQRVRKVSGSGIITTIAGNGIPGYSGDGGPATSAQLNNPSGIAVSAAGDRVYVSDSSNGRIRVLIAPPPPIAPVITSYGISNSADYGPVSPGALATIIFVPDLAITPASSTAAPFPTSLGGAAVSFNGQAAPLLYVSQGQINVQVPWETAVGNATVTVSVNGMNSNAVTVPVLFAAPGIFFSTFQSAIQNSDSTLNNPNNPALAGSTIVAYLTGGGPVSPPVASGAPSPANPPSVLTAPYSAMFGSSSAVVAFAGLAPGAVGLVQMNIVVPPAMPTGDYLLAITVGGSTANTANVSVIGNGTSVPCASYPSDFIPYASLNYISAPNGAGDRLLVGNTMQSGSDPNANYEEIVALPLPAATNQQYCGTVQLASGENVVAYVPTPAERVGDFSPFSGLLLDPTNNDRPFPGGIIPISRIGGIYAWRIAPVGAPVPKQ